MFDETCKWRRVKDLVWSTECKHQIGTPRSWEPLDRCMCCGKILEVVNEGRDVDSSAVHTGAVGL